MSIEKWHKKAKEGSIVAQGILGNAYLWGEEVTPDYQKALKWLELPATKGVARSLFNLGYMYEKGLGVTQDVDKAIEYYKKAAKREDLNAFFSLGTIYNNGDGVDQDKQEAEKWFNDALKIGDGIASQIAYKFLNGYGLPKSLKYAYLWYNIEKKRSIEQLENIKSIIDDIELTEAEELLNVIK